MGLQREVPNDFRKGKFELLALSELKMKEKGDISWCGVNIICVGVQENDRAREGVGVLLNDVGYSGLVEFRYVNSKILWIKVHVCKVCY